MDCEQDAQLLAQIAAGSETALGEFYRQHERTVHAFAMSRLRNEFEAADCLNEVMMEVWKHASRYEGRAKVRTWLLGIANHKVLDQLRRNKRHITEELDEQIPDEDSMSVLDALAGADDAEIVRGCLQGLSEAHQQVIHLAFFEDMPYEDIAAIVGCPEGTVKTRVFHAKQKMKDCLSQNGLAQT